MTVNNSVLTDVSLLRALCDTLVPAVDAADATDSSLMARSASDVGIDGILPSVLPGLSAHVRAGVADVLTALGEDFVTLPLDARVARWHQIAGEPRHRLGAFVLQTTVTAMFYTAPDDAGRNPSWPDLGFPGPLLDPPSPAEFPKTLAAIEPAGELSADVVVVGSGAGGGVAAAELAAAGLSVLVLEKGSYRNEPDFPQLEALSFPNLYLDGGFIWSENGSAGLLAGSTVGGGTTVNSMASLPTPDRPRREWEAAGMEGVTGPSYDDHMATVMARINAVPENTVPNSVNRLLERGLDARGLRYITIPRNAKDADTRYCGSCNSGCLLGCKQSTMKTFLQDASDRGARLLPDCAVTRILTEGGRCAGVEAVVRRADGTTETITIRATQVVVAAGALMTPLILEASGIGGRAVGKNLHVHPSYFMSGVFDQEVEGWRGHILTTMCDEWAEIVDNHGFLVEAAPMGLGFWSSFTPWHDGAQHKQDMLRFRRVAGVWGFARDHGAGEVVRDPEGRPLVRWDIDDEVDLAVIRRCHVELARILEAAGAEEIFTFLPGDPRWRRGEDFEAFLAVLDALEKEDVFTLSAHQSGSCAAGTDPNTSVVDGRGQLHDVPGVYVADASALPTAPGVNPMVSIEAYARRTAQFVAADAFATAP